MEECFVRKKILFFAMTLLLLTRITASADVLGEQNGGWSTYMGAFTYFHNVQFNSDSVGKQNEYYVEYTPNEDRRTDCCERCEHMGNEKY